MRSLLLVLASLALLRPATAALPTYPHDVHDPFPLPTPEANDVRRLAVHPDGSVWAATRGGVFHRSLATGSWTSLAAGENLAPTFDVALDASGNVWIGAWNGLFRVQNERAVRIGQLSAPVSALGPSADGSLLIGGPRGYHHVRGEAVSPIDLGATRYLERIQSPSPGEWWITTGMGCYVSRPDSQGYLPFDRDRLSAATRGIAFGPDRKVWVASLGGLQEYRSQRYRRTWTPEDGLPSADVRCVALDGQGTLWVGTATGLARRETDRWQVRAGRRWLLNDEVRDIAFGSDGAAWIATAAGVSCLRRTHLSFADKAQHFHDILEARHVRPPGIVEKCALPTPGDLTRWEPEDDDNDGGYTALAMAMETYRHAVTGDPSALAAARRALSACEFLLDVTGPHGFLARSVIPASWQRMHDPNETLADTEWAERQVNDPRNKRVPIRWRPSADGRWLWKGDTSSDEVTAHFFAYYVVHELTRDDTDRARVRRQILRIVDHLLAHGLVLRDLDGLPTRWGVWAPEFLNRNPDWAMERGINSVEILSFLKLAHHVSGDPRYDTVYHQLLRDEGYARNVLEAPNLNPAWRTYIDFELLAFAYPALLALERDSKIHRIYRQSLERWHEAVRADGNPLFEFLYALHGHRRRANLTGASRFLQDTPLDLIRWDVDLSVREDVTRVRSPLVETWQTRRLYPPSEIAYSRTDQNPWLVRQGDGGRTEGDGVFWLLPYWMGRHHGFLE